MIELSPDPVLCRPLAGVFDVLHRFLFITHIIEREIAQFEDAGSDEDITEKLKGLGYIS